MVGTTVSTAVPVFVVFSSRVCCFSTLTTLPHLLLEMYTPISFLNIYLLPSHSPRTLAAFTLLQFLFHALVSLDVYLQVPLFLLSAPPDFTYQPFLGPPASLFCVRSIFTQALHSHGTPLTTTRRVEVIVGAALHRSDLRVFVICMR